MTCKCAWLVSALEGLFCSRKPVLTFYTFLVRSAEILSLHTAWRRNASFTLYDSFFFHILLRVPIFVLRTSCCLESKASATLIASAFDILPEFSYESSVLFFKKHSILVRIKTTVKVRNRIVDLTPITFPHLKVLQKRLHSYSSAPPLTTCTQGHWHVTCPYLCAGSPLASTIVSIFIALIFGRLHQLCLCCPCSH